MDLFDETGTPLGHEDAASGIATDAAWALLNRGDLHLEQREPREAIQLYQQAQDLFTQLADQFGQASSLARLAHGYSIMADWPGATQHYIQALDISQKTGHGALSCAILGNLGFLAQGSQQPQKALEYFLQALEYARTLEDTSVLRFTLNNIKNVYFEQGSYAQAIRYSEQFLEANMLTDNRRDDAVCLATMGVAYVHLQQRERGVALIRQARNLLAQSTNPEAPGDLVRVQSLLAELAASA
jgi:tetratricopeptide (TPR) repeat protein